MEEKTLQPSAGEENKPQNKKTIQLKEKNNNPPKGVVKSKSIKKPEKTKEKGSSTKSKTLKKETAKKKSDKIEKPKKTKEKNSLNQEKGEIVKESNYSSNSIEDLIKIYQELSTGEAWLKNHKSIQSVNHQFNIKFQIEIDEQKKKFLGEGGNEIDFLFKPEYKKSFDQITFEYRKKRREHFKDQEVAQKLNLERRKSIIEEIKNLIDQNQINSKTYRDFRALQESWYNTGQVPRNESQNLWDTFKHHVERFYAFLHLDREFREMDYNYNYEEKVKIIERAEALKEYPDTIKASRDLNILHKQWKNDLGPVAKEHRENLWTRFQNASKEIQERRQNYQKDITGAMKDNLAKKEELLLEMHQILKDVPKNHVAWQNALKKFNTIRENFKNIGYVPAKESKASWKSFREVGTDFMRLKNIFYKQQKKAFNSNIDSKKKLISLSKEILNIENWQSCVQKMKDFQKEWKAIGFVPRKLDNKLWKEFSDIQKEYFNRLKSGYEHISPEKEILLNKKKSFLDKIKNVIFTDEIDLIKEEYSTHLIKWNQLESLDSKNEIKMNESFSNILIGQLRKTKLEKEDLNYVIEDFNLKVLKNDPHRLEKEFQAKKSLLFNLQAELTQLENNLEFFSNSSVENPLFKNVEKQISLCQSKIDNAQMEYINLKQIKNAQNKSTIDSEEKAKVSDNQQLLESGEED
ncbi:DUF349 domain-containing protein [Flavobacteriaceae bacterium]|nr:DUF349 domain-containing protein [Flavobacteriaceae bacterium]